MNLYEWDELTILIVAPDRGIAEEILKRQPEYKEFVK